MIVWVEKRFVKHIERCVSWSCLTKCFKGENFVIDGSLNLLQSLSNIAIPDRLARMKALGWWLMLVGSLRLASVWFGFFNIWALRLAVFSSTTMTEVHGRTFGVWTLLTCTLCYLCAFNLDNKPLYIATFLSFIYAFGHFLSEYFIYQTMVLANLTTVGVFAGTSIIWMLLHWNSHKPQEISKQE